MCMVLELIARGRTDEEFLKPFYMKASSTRSDHQSNIYTVGHASSTSVKHSEAIVIRKPPKPVMMTSNSTIFPGSSASNIQSTWTTTTPLPSSSLSSAQESEVTASPIVINSNSVTSDENKTVFASDNSRLTSSSTSSSKVTEPTSTIAQTIPKKEKKKTHLHAGLAFRRKSTPPTALKQQKIKAISTTRTKNV